MRIWENRERVCECDHRDRDGEREKEGRKKVGQTAVPNSLLHSPALSILCPPPLYCHWGEGKEVTHSYKHLINLPATLLVLDTVPALSVRLSVMPPSCCHLSAAGARLHRHGHGGVVPTRCLFFLPALCQNSMADSSVLHQCIALRRVFDRDHDKTWPRLICVWGIYSLFSWIMMYC